MITQAITEESAEIERYEAYLKADPGNTLLWINLGDLYHQAGRLDESIACYEKCMILDGENAVARSRLASLLITGKRFADAEKLLRTLLAKEPDNPVLLHNLGVSLYAQQRWTDALAAFEQARSAGLKDARNLAYTVYALHQNDATGEAMAVAMDWLQQAPGPATEGYISLLEMDHGDMQAAYQRAQRVLAEQPDNADAATVVGNWQLQTQEIEKAALHFEAVVRRQPNNPRGWLGLGLVQLYRQRHEDAIQCFERVLACSPNHPGTLVTLGWARLAHKDFKGSETAFRQAIVADRNFGEAHGGLASALVFQGRKSEAEKEIRLGLALDKQNFGAIFARSIALSLGGKRQVGEKLLARLLQQAPAKGAKPLIENIQTFVRQQGLRGPGEPPGND
ncbi:MAG TPA: tetratricopeptide repeat protein [Gammaproteobacteria bacterium]|nr:tetratricopeptide repeat protein [Gammaproteobacteria bacterium]